MEQKQSNIFETINQWFRESIIVKLSSIGFLILILLLPASWLESLIEERQERASSVIKEVAGKWSENQILSGPVLVLPHKQFTKVARGEKEQVVESVEKAYFLPNDLNVNSVLEPQKLKRGIFEVVVYNSKLKLKGSFLPPDLSALHIISENVVWEDAYLILGISDLRGIVETPSIKFGDSLMRSEPGQEPSNLFSNNISVRLKLNKPIEGEIPFSIDMSLKGSGQIQFLPTGKSSHIKVSGNWGNPSFIGAYLPEERKVTDSSFYAEWKVLHFNRPFPQQWKGSRDNFSSATFGVDLLVPVDQYQKTTRTAKYGILIILLTFISLFMIEIICKIRIHPFQYILIGAALIIYYSLLLSFSEQLGYDVAYIIASIATVGLISFYSRSFLPTARMSSLLTFLLVLFYSFIYTITQLQDFALLIGSIGLFIIIGILMYVSRKINWYGDAPVARV